MKRLEALSDKPIMAKHRKNNIPVRRLGGHNCATTLADNVHVARGEVEHI